jgi:hypothetical protein
MKSIVVKFTYFKKSGKLYIRANHEMIEQDGEFLYMNIIKKVRNMILTNNLPDLINGWDGYLVVESEDVVPTLLDCSYIKEIEAKWLSDTSKP